LLLEKLNLRQQVCLLSTALRRNSGLRVGEELVVFSALGEDLAIVALNCGWLLGLVLLHHAWLIEGSQLLLRVSSTVLISGVNRGDCCALEGLLGGHVL